MAVLEAVHAAHKCCTNVVVKLEKLQAQNPLGDHIGCAELGHNINPYKNDYLQVDPSS